MRILFLLIFLQASHLNASVFSVKEGQIVDPKGYPFTIRGMNIPAAYYYDKSFDAISSIKDYGFNSLRIVWCAEGFVSGFRCKDKDFHSKDKLRSILQEARNQRLVSILNFQNATGSDSEKDLNKIVDFITSEESLQLIKENEENLIINVANEWHGSWANAKDQGRFWYEQYKIAIKKIRESGIKSPLIIDSCGWGQDPECVYNYGKKLKELDNNIIFSFHVYEYLGAKDQDIDRLFSKMENLELPFIIGEYASEHYGKRVAWRRILEHTAKANVGRIVWSFFGNNSSLRSLDFVSKDDFSELTENGKKIFQHPFGVQSQSTEACYYSDTCDNSL